MIVQQYVKGALTDLHDPLPAIAGLADRMSVQLGDNYVAGCWRKGPWHGLVWHNDEGQHYKRTSEYYAASWSWASIPDGKIGFVSTSNYSVDEAFRVHDCHVKPPSQLAKYGAVRSASLTVSARVFSPRYTHCRNSAGAEDNSVAIDSLENDDVEPASRAFYLDAILNEDQEGVIFLSGFSVYAGVMRGK